MDAFDRKIVDLLQRDATLSLADIAERVGLSSTPCWRRIQNLEKAGVIRRRVALCDPDALNVGVTVFVQVRTGQHSGDWLKTFARAVDDIDEITGCWRMAGQVDYLLQIQVPDIAGYDAVYKRLIAVPGLSDLTATFAMERMKAETALPTTYA